MSSNEGGFAQSDNAFTINTIQNLIDLLASFKDLIPLHPPIEGSTTATASSSSRSHYNIDPAANSSSISQGKEINPAISRSSMLPSLGKNKGKEISQATSSGLISPYSGKNKGKETGLASSSSSISLRLDNNKGKEISSAASSSSISPSLNKDEGKETTSSNNDGSHSRSYTNQQISDQLAKWVADLIYIRSAISNLQGLALHVNINFDTLPKHRQDFSSLMQHPKKVKEVTRILTNLKLAIPYTKKLNSSNNTDVKTVRTVQDLFDVLLKLDAYQQFKDWPAIKNFEQNFKSENREHQHCLLCFSVFPEGAVVPKRLLMYWWVGEGWIHPQDDDYEKATDDILGEFLKKEKEYVEPVLNSKQKLVGFRMHALIRFAVIFLADCYEFFSFDSTWNPTGDLSSCPRAALVTNDEESSRDTLMSLNPEKLITLFNVNDSSPDLKLKWLLRIREAKVLCLGRWKENSISGIEVRDTSEENSENGIKVEDAKFLTGLKNMKHLKFFSLQGVSGVQKIPKEVIKLTDLTILDLKACYKLEALPNSIESLPNLTHLDVSDCISLDCMPKGIESLKKLQVLKGFVISARRSIVNDLPKLTELTKLTKLSINIKDFHMAQGLKPIEGCKSLLKLTIAWEETSSGTPVTTPRVLRRLSTLNAFTQENNQLTRASTTIMNRSTTALCLEFSFPKYLEKLDLQGFPETEASWLMPSKLKFLKKLYIRGGNLQCLNKAQGEGDKWNVKILRLKSLPGLKMTWRELQREFPDLIYLEKVECSKLNLFPCHENGVWLNRKKLSRQSLAELGLRWSFLSAKPRPFLLAKST